jgi:hypothetical protein
VSGKAHPLLLKEDAVATYWLNKHVEWKLSKAVALQYPFLDCSLSKS